MFGTLQPPKLQITPSPSTGFTGSQTGITTKPQPLLQAGLGSFRFAAPKRIVGPSIATPSTALVPNPGGAQILPQNQNISTPRLPEVATLNAASSILVPPNLSAQTTPIAHASILSAQTTPIAHASNLSAQTPRNGTETKVQADTEAKSAIGLQNESKLMKVDNKVSWASAAYSGAHMNGKLSYVHEDKVLGKPLTRHESGFTTTASDQVVSSLMASSQTTIGLNSEKEPQPPEEKPKETLYRCALCGDLVFQNQLEEHVKVCPEDKHQVEAGQATKKPAIEDERDEVSSRNSTDKSYLLAPEDKDVVLDKKNAESTPSPGRQTMYPNVSSIKLSDDVDEDDPAATEERVPWTQTEPLIDSRKTANMTAAQKTAETTAALAQHEHESSFTDTTSPRRSEPAARYSALTKQLSLERQCVSYNSPKTGNGSLSPPMRKTLPVPGSPKVSKTKNQLLPWQKTVPAPLPTCKARIKTSSPKRTTLVCENSSKSTKTKNAMVTPRGPSTKLANPDAQKTVVSSSEVVMQGHRTTARGSSKEKVDQARDSAHTGPAKKDMEQKKWEAPNAKTARGTRNANQKSNKPMARARSEEPKKKWTGWAESDIATHTMQTAERKIRTMDKLAKELNTKIEEECTFAPKLCELSQKMQLSRTDFHASLAKQEEVKARHLEEIRGAVYADATHRPVISNKAKNLHESRKLRDQVESADELYQRLHSSNMRTPRKENPAPTFQPNICASSSSAMNQRDLPTTTLLYSDALERRARRQQAIEEVDREVKQMKNQILPKSRKYYWMMLEKQIKTAFDRVCTTSDDTTGHPYIRFEHLDFFLVELGCLPPVSSEEEALERHAKLKQSLWNHLDPHKKGGVDIITITVFFHLLMGAVETTPTSYEEEDHALYLTGASASGAKASLESIIEEDDGGAAPEDTIEQIVKRFDPKRLRQEFHTLYSHRLHYVKTSCQKAEAEPSVNEFTTEVQRRNGPAKALGDNVHKKLKERAGDSEMSHVQLLYVRKQMQDERLRKVRLQAAQEADDSCPFHPNVSATMVYNVQRSMELNSRSRHGKLHTDLFDQAKCRKERMEEMRIQHAKKQVQKEMENCSFAPDTSASEKTYYTVKNKNNMSHVPRGFDLTTTRLRNAYSERRQRELNLANVTEQFPNKNYAKIASRAKPFKLQTEKRASMPDYQERPRSESLQPRKRKPTVSTRERENREGVALTEHLPVRGRQLGTTPKTKRAASLPPASIVDEKEFESAVPQEDCKEVHDVPESPQSTERPTDAAEKNVLLFVDVNITPEKTERLIVYKDQSVEEAATSFAAEHNLPEQLSQKLQYLLGLQMEQLHNEK